jgi:hypothetical protein
MPAATTTATAATTTRTARIANRRRRVPPRSRAPDRAGSARPEESEPRSPPVMGAAGLLKEEAVLA